MTEVIRYEHVDISYKGKRVVHDVSFSVEKGEILGIVGESGSGKSTLIKAAMGLLGRDGLVSRGDIWYKGMDLPDLKPGEMRKLCGPELGMIFQTAGSSFCPIRTVRAQLYEFMTEHKKIKADVFENQAEELLEKFGFEDPKRVLDSYPFELSGGMQQRVGIAVAMLLNPKILMADEPTSALDVTVQKQVIEEMLMVRKTFGTSILLVTHNMGVIRAMADKVLVLHEGEIMEYGVTEEVFEQPQSAYTKKLLAAVPKTSEVGKMSVVLAAEHLTKTFVSQGRENYTAVDDVSFSVESGEKLGIIGESGSGKTTVVNMITRLLDASSGMIRLDGEDITSKKGKELKEVYKKMQMVFQTPTESFDPRRKLGDGIAESLINFGMRKKEAMVKAGQLLELCGLGKEYAERYPHEVSGGQCQRAAIARAIAIDPRLLILDEATSALDVTIQEEILELLNKLKTERNMTYLFICHDIALVQQFCDRVLVMHQGKIVEEGTPDEVIRNPKTEYTRRLIESVL